MAYVISRNSRLALICKVSFDSIDPLLVMLNFVFAVFLSL